MNTYQVVRPFPGYPVGAVLSDTDFATPLRATQLVDARFLTKMVNSLAQHQPTSQTLNDATIRQLSVMLSEVVDRGVIEAALGRETRESAIKALEKRLSEMEETNTNEHSN